MTQRRLGPTVAALVVGLSACALGAQDDARVAEDGSVPFDLLEPDAPALIDPGPPGPNGALPLCFVDGDLVSPVDVPLPEPSELVDIVNRLTEPPERTGGALRTALGEDPIADSVELIAGVAHVDLLPAVTELGSDDQLLGIAQIVCTLTSQPGVGPVSFTLEGGSVDVPRGDGSLTSGRVSRDDYASVVT